MAGLIRFEDTREFDIDGNLVRYLTVVLTPKGKLVSQLLADTSNLLLNLRNGSGSLQS